MEYIKYFEQKALYESYINGNPTLPNVSYTQDTNKVFYNITKPRAYLTFKAIEDSTFKLANNSCQYSLDGGGTWNDLNANTDTPTVPAGNKILFKATIIPNNSYGIGTFSSTGKFDVSGNIMSMMYGDDFEGQTKFTGTDNALYKLFNGCDKLVDASNLLLPATTLTDFCYGRMFQNCTSLVKAPKLPATTLVNQCYYNMFNGCTSLVTAPELPATTLDHGCYLEMFNGCTSLVNAPELPATELVISCYAGMFNGCTSLTTAPKLTATTLRSRCYHYMFKGCTSLTTPPQLPATNLDLAKGCYECMFQDCTSLVTAPQLPATTLFDDCYDSMFSGCTSLVNAPELLATTLDLTCYQNMFNGCTSLSRIVMLATDIPALNCLDNWASGIASKGVLIKHKDMTTLPTGTSGIPMGWTVEDHITFTELTHLEITADNVRGNDTTTTIYYTVTGNGIDYQGNNVSEITGTAVSEAFPQNTSETETIERTITFEYMGMTASTTITHEVWVNFEQQYITFETIDDSQFRLGGANTWYYSIDNGISWNRVLYNYSTPVMPAGIKILFKATNPHISSNYGMGTISSTGRFIVSGNIMSLVYGNNFEGKTDLSDKKYMFLNLFKGCTKLIDASNLIIPATTLSSYCYDSMFDGCSLLVKAPELPAATLATYCYRNMFKNCTSLNKIVMLATDIKATNCLNNWVSGVTSTGIFIKHPDMTSLPTGNNGIPNGWEVIDKIAS